MEISFTCHKLHPRHHRRHYAGENDVKVVLQRLPDDVKSRLRHVHFNDQSNRRKRLGYVNGGRRELSLCAQPLNLSLTPALRGPQTPELFGALRGTQWPPLAIRRFMLYDVFLHELGHLQVIHPENSNLRRKFAREVCAQDFADTWRENLWAEEFPGDDLAHNPPSDEELADTTTHWPKAHAEYRRGLAALRRNEPERAFKHFTAAIEMYKYHSPAMEALSTHFILGWGIARTKDSTRIAVDLCKRALRIDPGLVVAQLTVRNMCD